MFRSEWGVSRWKRVAAGLALLMGYGFAHQEQSSEGTRQLYYLATSAKDPLPAVTPASIAQPAPKTGAVHLGLRYNLVLLSSDGRAEPIPSDRVLRAGDCFSIDVQSNRSGYLYVLAKQSSGSWMPLLPSPEMPAESNVIDPGKKVRIPKSYCFEVHNPPGMETLFVVLSRDPRDFYELYEGIKGGSGAPAPPQRTEGSMQMADAGRLNAAVEHINERFATRDISITKINEPSGKEDTRGSVYVVNTSDKPVSSIVTQIKIRHH